MQVTVVASDGGLTTRQALTVTVTNLNEAGSLTLSSEHPQVETPFTVTLTDPDIVSDYHLGLGAVREPEYVDGD